MNHSQKYEYYLEKFRTSGIPAGLEGLRPESFQSKEGIAAYVVAAIEVWGDYNTIYQTRCRHEITHDGHPSRIDRRRHQTHPMF